jgi:hypothetical protein
MSGNGRFCLSRLFTALNLRPRTNPVTSKRRSLRKIAAELAETGHLNAAQYRGNSEPRPFNQASIKAMIEGPMPAETKEA